MRRKPPTDGRSGATSSGHSTFGSGGARHGGRPAHRGYYRPQHPTGPIVYTANGGGTVGIVLKGPDVKPGNKLVAAVDPDDHRDFELDH